MRLRPIIKGVLAGLLVFGACGCAAPQPRPQPPETRGWVPADKDEFKMTVGQTVLEAIFQYERARAQYLRERGGRPQLDPDPSS